MNGDETKNTTRISQSQKILPNGITYICEFQQESYQGRIKHYKIECYQLGEYSLQESTSYKRDIGYVLEEFEIPDGHKLCLFNRNMEILPASVEVLQGFKSLFKVPLLTNICLLELLEIFFIGKTPLASRSNANEFLTLLQRGIEEIPNPTVYVSYIQQFMQINYSQASKPNLQQLYIFTLKFLLYSWAIHRDRNEIFHRLVIVYRIDRSSLPFDAKLYFNGSSLHDEDDPIYDLILEGIDMNKPTLDNHDLNQIWQKTEQYLYVFTPE